MQITLLLFAAGIAGVQAMPVLADVGTLGALSILVILCAIGPRTRPVSALAAGFVFASLFAFSALSHRLDAELDGREVVMTGHIVGIPQADMRRLRFIFKPERIQGLPETQRLPRRIQLSWYGRYADLRAGERWRLPVTLRTPAAPPAAGFDLARWAYVQRIDALGRINAHGMPERLEARRTLSWLRQSLAERLYGAVESPSAAGLLVGLIVGDRQYIEQGNWRVLEATGTSHLLAISGLHIGLLASTALLLVGTCWRVVPALNRRLPAPVAGAWAGFTAAAVYAALAGFSLPTQRALIMLLVVLLAVILRRFLRPWHALQIALVAVLLRDPAAPLGAGFWLSFGAVACLIAAGVGRAPQGRWLTLLRVQFVLSLALLPLLVFWFGQLPWSAPFANLVAIPAVSMLIVPLAFLGTVLLFAIPTAGQATLELAALALKLLMRALEWFAGLGELGVVEQPPAWALFTAAVAVLLLLAPRGTPGRALAAPLLLPVLFAPSQTTPPGEAWLSVSARGGELQAVVRENGRSWRWPAPQAPAWLPVGPWPSDTRTPSRSGACPPPCIRNLAGRRVAFADSATAIPAGAPLDLLIVGAPGGTLPTEPLNWRAGARWVGPRGSIIEGADGNTLGSGDSLRFRLSAGEIREQRNPPRRRYFHAQ